MTSIVSVSLLRDFHALLDDYLIALCHHINETEFKDKLTSFYDILDYESFEDTINYMLDEIKQFDITQWADDLTKYNSLYESFINCMMKYDRSKFNLLLLSERSISIVISEYIEIFIGKMLTKNDLNELFHTCKMKSNGNLYILK